MILPTFNLDIFPVQTLLLLTPFLLGLYFPPKELQIDTIWLSEIFDIILPNFSLSSSVLTAEFKFNIKWMYY